MLILILVNLSISSKAGMVVGSSGTFVGAGGARSASKPYAFREQLIPVEDTPKDVARNVRWTLVRMTELSFDRLSETMFRRTDFWRTNLHVAAVAEEIWSKGITLDRSAYAVTK